MRRSRPLAEGRPCDLIPSLADQAQWGRLHCGNHPWGRPRTFLGIAMNWILLLLAGLRAVVWAVGLKYTEGFTRLWPSIGTLLAMIVSFGLLSVAMKTLPLGTAYAVWVGIGVIGSALLGVYLFAEPMTTGRLISLALILTGIIGLKLAETA